mgnify:CR=1 FL=1
MKTFFQVSKFKNGNRSFTGKIKSKVKPQDCINYDWYSTKAEALEQNKF